MNTQHTQDQVMATHEVAETTNNCPTQPADEIEECDKRYERMDKLGEGTYGLVYRAKDKLTNEVSAALQVLHIMFCVYYS
jgi:serine/threonine protein kinase